MKARVAFAMLLGLVVFHVRRAPVGELRNALHLYFNNTSALAARHKETRPKLKLVIQLGGELGNNLGFFVHGKRIQFEAEKHGFDVEVVGAEHQSHKKWKRPYNDIQSCFPVLRKIDFERGVHNEEDNALIEIQSATLGTNASLMHNPTDWNFVRQATARLNETFIFSRGMVYPEPDDPHFAEYADLVNFNSSSTACCKSLPFANETVLHIRSFSIEMKRSAQLGFLEATPKQMVEQVLANFTPNDPIAIISRFPDSLDAYLEAFDLRKLAYRVIKGQTGVQDWCFLLHAQHRIIGYERSTFMLSAMSFGQAKENIVYGTLDVKKEQRPTPRETKIVNGRVFRFPFVDE